MYKISHIVCTILVNERNCKEHQLVGGKKTFKNVKKKKILGCPKKYGNKEISATYVLCILDERC